MVHRAVSEEIEVWNQHADFDKEKMEGKSEQKPKEKEDICNQKKREKQTGEKEQYTKWVNNKVYKQNIVIID